MTSSPGDEDGSITSSVVTMNMPVSKQTRESGATLPNMAQAAANQVPSLELQKTKSNSFTSYQRPQNNPDQISPSNGQPTREGSPRSLHSESSHTTPAPRRPVRGCRFEAGMAKASRRVPYSLGPDKLDQEPEERQRKLGSQEEAKVTFDMKELYAQLVPNADSVERRTLLVQKLEMLLRARWPGQQINVSVFGSTGNALGTSDSDVDICITTDCREIEHVCSIADLLDKNGMERIVCVSSAKVPIVKMWDPELQVACDMNVNNPIALENTQMIRSYTTIDDRFRPLAMIVKYWAKKRILNDAALGGTLSSYTWICMVLNFLQTRDPPILPSLQQKPGLAPNVLNGVNVAFDKDIDVYRGFGVQNRSTLGQLLFQFFRFYGHEYDFEENALSVRLGKIIPKSQKAWHLLQDNRLCVEEPFNTSRNLANTADDTSMRGIHLELRRACSSLAQGKLNECCKQYEAVPETRKQTETFIHPTARPLIPQAPAQPAPQTHRSNRNNLRSGRNSNRNSGRRASNPAGRNSTYLHDLPFQMTPQELQLQAQHQQHLLHDQLFQQYQYLQLQEQELRMQLYHQRQRGLVSGQSVSQNTFPNGAASDSPAALSSTASLRMGVSPAMYQNRYSTTSPFLRNATPVSGVMTNPASPLLSNVVPDSRRYTRRTSMTNPSPTSSLRAQSQPARALPFSGGFAQVRPANEVTVDRLDTLTDRRTLFSYHSPMFMPHVTGSLYDAGRRPAEYMGYYVGQSPSLPAHSRSTAISPLPSHAGLAIQDGGLSPKQSSRSSRLPSITSSPSLPSAHLEDTSEVAASSDLAKDYHTAPEQPDSPKGRPGPLVIDSSVYSPQRRRPTIKASNKHENCTISASTSDDLGIDTPSSSDDQYQEYRKTSLARRRGQNGASQAANGISDHLQDLSITPSIALALNGSDEKLAAIAETRDGLEMRVNEPPAVTGGDDAVSLVKNDLTSIGVGNRKKKMKPDKISPTAMEIPNEAGAVLSPKTNGQGIESNIPTTTKHLDGATGWQTQKKKKRSRKSIKSENDVMLLNRAGGELLPLDESLRKGG